MTNERAIELLNRISDSQFDGPHGDTRREALSMAVRALESNLVKESGDLVKDLVEDSSSDLISRQQAIEAFEPEHRTDWYTPRIIEVLEALPSAQPEEVVPHKNYKYLSDYWCECGWHLGKKGEVKYCSDCGRKVKWNG